MLRRSTLFALIVAFAALWTVGGWFAAGPLEREISFEVEPGESLIQVAQNLDRVGAVDNATIFRVRARLLGGTDPVQAGRFLLPKGASERSLLDIVQGGKIVRRFVTIPEGMPSIMVRDRLMALPGLS